MKIGIDIRSTLKQKTGIGYYTLNLINGLAKVDPENLYFLYSHMRLFDFKKRLPDVPAPNFKHRTDRLSFRPDLKMNDMDTFHSSSYDMPKFKSAKLITTIHDIIPLVYPEGYPSEVLNKLEHNIKKVLNESALIITDSNNTKKDLTARFGPKNRIDVIYPGRDESLAPIDNKKKASDYLKNKYGIEKEFILFVGTIEKRKNVAGLIEAFLDLKTKKKIPHLLVIVGMRGWGGDAAFRLASNSNLKNEIIFTGYVTRKDLESFYNIASAFVYPSFYEGFGFPIIEAFSFGVPVVTADTTSCGEIAGDAALIVNPEDKDALREAILKVIDDDNYKKKLIEKGFARLNLFSWKKTAEQFKKIFYEKGG